VVGTIIVGLIFILSGIGCFFWPANLWRSEVRRYQPADPDGVEPSDRALFDMRLRGILCFLASAVIMSTLIW
jgi:uncharacterized protein YjeT (DUF2065 family)